MQKILFFFLLLSSMGCASVQPESISLEFTGAYKPVTRENDAIYCYCSRVAYLEVCGNARIPLCFEQGEGIDACQDITIKGYYEYLQPTMTGAREACPESERRLFIVTEWQCQ